MRNFDTHQQFEAIKKSAVDAVREIFPVEGKLRDIRLDNITVEDTLDTTDYKSQVTAKSKDQTWGVPVIASLSLVDKASGKVIDSSTKVRLFTLPKITDRFSYIVAGNEYQVHNQLRLKPGVYTLRKQNGELKTQVNLAKGKNFDLAFDERSGLFSIQKVGGGQANIPLYPVLTHLGISPSLVADAWGPGLQQANAKSDPRAVTRAEAAFGIKPGELKTYLDGTVLGHDTTKMQLGQGFDKVDGPMLLAAAKNLLDVHQGKKPPTDRDSLAFKELHSVEDYLHERIQKNKKALAFRLKRNIDNIRRTKLTQIVNPGSFNSVIETFFTQDDKSATPEQTNPLEMLSGQYKATIMGSGGIKSAHAITPEMREIHPSHYGFLDPIHTPESDKVGANLNLPMGVVKDGKTMKMALYDKDPSDPAKQVVTVSPVDAFNAYVAFPGQEGKTTVKTQFHGQVLEVPRAQVNYWTPSAVGLFSWSTNLIPFLSSNQGNRAMMASKMLEQAIALKHREAPLVQIQTGKNPGQSLENHVGQTLVVKAPVAGVVKSVTGDQIVIKTDSGDQKLNLYNNFSLNRKSFLHHYAKVKPGDKVKAGQTVAESNFTRDGTLALGTNMRVAYLPYKGLTFEDGIVITQTAAQKLTSEHIHKKSMDLNETYILGIAAFRGYYPNVIAPANMKKLGTDGVIRKGETVRHGEILAAVLQRRAANPMIGAVSRALADRPKDVSIVWTLEDEGVVLDVQRDAGKITIQIKTEEAARIGDKLSGRYGNKGIVTKIIPDAEAPHDAKGKPVDILLNPHGVISRINIGQIYESATGKAALKAGKPLTVQNFSGEDYLEATKKTLAEHGVEDKEELFDPITKKSLGKVHVGNPYILKLFKQGTVNYSVRQGGPGTGYDANQQPLKAGGEDGAKSMDLLTIYSMLSHGARANLREMSSIKSNQNDEFWKALKAGQQLPPPKAPFVYEKFMGYLRGAGIDVKKSGTEMTLAPLTDKQIMATSAGEVRKPVFYRGKDMEPLRGGFFDPVLTGGFRGTKWNHVELAEPVVNPVFENAVSKLTGLGKKYDALMAGTLHLDKKTGEFNAEGKGVTGGAAVEHLLKQIDVDAEIKSLSAKIKVAKADKLDDINKRLRYLQALKDNKMRPEEAYIRKVMPVLPPIYRPVYPLPDGSMASSDINYLYQNVGILNMMMKQPVMALLPEGEKAAIRSDMYQHAAGVAGLTDLNIKGRPRKGFISEIKGGQKGPPKEGFFIDKMLSKKQDFVGRGTIIPEPDLGIDEMAMPEEMAWKLFEPFVTRELKNYSKTPLEAKEEIKNKTPLAKRALETVMAQRHVLLNRAPSLHKFSIMAFKPKITAGRALKIPPLVCKGFNADYDGDTMTVHVPITDEANREAAGMLPSANLFKPGTGALMIQPTQEGQIGLYYLSQTPAGRARINAITGKDYPVTDTLDKKAAGTLLMKMARGMSSGEFSKAVVLLKAEGDRHAYETGFTIGLSDLDVGRKDRDVIVRAAQALVLKTKDPAALGREAAKGAQMLDAAIEHRIKGKNNALYDMVNSGARGDKNQLRQILGTPLFVTDARGRTIPTPIKKSYAEGLDIGDYWVSMYGARRGAMDRSIQSSLPGAFSKDIMASVVDNVITAADCGTHDGIVLQVGDADALDRYTAGEQHGQAHNTLVTHQVQSQLKAAGAKDIKVRSPLTCHRPKGTCARCHGLDEHGQMPGLGENIGAKAGQTISEPLVQMIMNCSEGNVVGEDGKVYAFIDYYESIEAQEVYDGHCWSKEAAAKIVDCGEVIDAPVAQNHAAEDDMLFFKTKTGHTLLVQANHPLWVYDAEGNATEKFAEDVTKGDRLKTDISMLTGAEEAPFNPYFMGRYLADGSAKYGNGTKRYEGIPVNIVVHQQDVEIRKKTGESARGVSAMGLYYDVADYDTHVAIYDVPFSEKFVRLVRGREAKLKRLCPGFNLWRSPDLEELLAGFIDGDGTVFLQHGTTVAQIYTSSYVLLQQMEIICSKLGIAFTPQVVSKQKLQKSPAFVAQLRFRDEGVRQHSIRMQRVPFSPLKYGPKCEVYEPITYIKKLWMWDLPVWDVKTSTRGFTCGMVRNHNTRHTGGVAGAGNSTAQGYKRIDQILKMPDIVSGAATLAPVTGKITRIDKGVGGGFNVFVGTAKAYVSSGLALSVKVGDAVKAGDALSEGVAKPQDLVKLKGMQPAQQYMVDQLQSAYKAQGVGIQKRVFETIVRSLGNTTQVLNNPKDSGHLPGDIAPYTVVQAYNRNLTGAVPIDEAEGYELAGAQGGFEAGHVVAASDIRTLRARGVAEVQIKKEAIKHAPFLKGITTLPLLKRNWMSALGYRQLSKALTEGASQGWKTDTSAEHPVPALAAGANFGKGKEGKY